MKTAMSICFADASYGAYSHTYLESLGKDGGTKFTGVISWLELGSLWRVVVYDVIPNFVRR